MLISCKRPCENLWSIVAAGRAGRGRCPASPAFVGCISGLGSAPRGRWQPAKPATGTDHVLGHTGNAANAIARCAGHRVWTATWWSVSAPRVLGISRRSTRCCAATSSTSLRPRHLHAGNALTSVKATDARRAIAHVGPTSGQRRRPHRNFTILRHAIDSANPPERSLG
jgi:hypothetical protein